jgi:hypothetical protein
MNRQILGKLPKKNHYDNPPQPLSTYALHADGQTNTAKPMREFLQLLVTNAAQERL